MSDLRSALHDLANDDGRRATDVSPRVIARLLGEVRALRPQPKGVRLARSFGLALAATLLVALAVPLGIVSRIGSRGSPPLFPPFFLLPARRGVPKFFLWGGPAPRRARSAPRGGMGVVWGGG